MSQEQKHHYRKVFKSDHLGVADLEDFIEEGRKLIFTIREVKQETGVLVAGNRGNFNIAYFTEPGVKPWVVNSGNSKILKGFAGGSPFVEDWVNIPIELIIDESVKMKGVTVGGIKIRPVKPTIEKVKPEFTEANFAKARTAGATLEQIKKSYTITPQTEQLWNNSNAV